MGGNPLKNIAEGTKGLFSAKTYTNIEDFQSNIRKVGSLGLDKGTVRKEGDMPVTMPVEQKAITGTVERGRGKRSIQTQDTILAGRLAQLELDNKGKTKLGASQ